MKIIRNVALLTLLLMPVCSQAMYDNGRHHMRRLATANAALTLAVYGAKRGTNQLVKMDPREVISVARVVNDVIDSYNAILPGFDCLTAALFLKEKKIQCVRIVGPDRIMLPVDDSHFFMLKDLHEKTQQEKQL